MSYDFWIEAADGKHIEPEFSDTHPALSRDGMAGTVQITETGYARIGNYTSNVSPMWTKALSASAIDGRSVRLSDFHGMRCEQAAPHMARAVEWAIENRDLLESLNPENGWGNVEGAITYLWDIQRACEASPDGRLQFWH